MSLSKDAQRIAICYWKLIPDHTITFNRPEIIHPRMRMTLDELTERGLLERKDDPRGPITWKPTTQMRKFTDSLPLPEFDNFDNSDRIPLTIPDVEK